MASVYPNNLDALPTTHVTGETILAQTIDDIADAANKIEAEVGVLPKGVYTSVRARLDALEIISFNTQSGTAYTLVLGDAQKTVTMSNVAANTLTVPPNSSVAFVIGTQIQVRQALAGQTTLTPGGGVTLNSRGGALKLFAQFSWATLVKVGTDTWDVLGDVTP